MPDPLTRLPAFDFAGLPARFGGRLLQAPPVATAVLHLLLDSRRAAEALPGSLFVALRGPQHDAHRYLPDVYAQGGRLFLVEENHALPGGLAAYPEAGIWAVPRPLATLQALAAAHRAAFGGPVLAVTGSNGKTVVKEWLAQLLAPDERVCRSPRSYNSQVGVPLSVWELDAERHSVGIFEAGISEVGEMARLAAVIQPTEGLFTMLGPAHDAGFRDMDEKLDEKFRLFEGPGFERLFYCHDQEAVRHAVQRRNLPGFGWSERGAAGAAVQFEVDDPAATAAATGATGPTGAAPNSSFLIPHSSFSEASSEATITAHYAGQRHTFRLALPDAPTRQNALHCLAVLLHRGVPPAAIQARLARLHPVAMRLEMKQGRHGSYLLDDTYNNDLAGLALALDALARQPRPGPRTVILSDLLETGLPPATLAARVLALLQAHGVTRLVAVGASLNEELRGKNEGAALNEELRRRKEELVSPANSSFPIPHSSLKTELYPSTEAFLAALDPASFAQQTILVKGARRFGFERVVAALQAQQHGTVLEVNLDALAHNFNHYRRQLRPGTRLMVMVKAFAYGAGSYEVASLLEFQRADYLAVAYPDEGVALRQAGIGLPIMVMNPAPDDLALLRRHRLEPQIYSFELLDAYLQTFGPADYQLPTTNHHQPTPPPIHLKLDTGMRRLGFGAADVPALAALLRQHGPQRLPVAALLTHLAAADDPAHDDFTRAQLAEFDAMSAVLTAAIGRPVLRHALNSAGIVRFPEAHYDMVRLGIGLHGVDATAVAQTAAQATAAPAAPEAPTLRPVSTLKTTISQLKTLPAGHTVGYGRRGAATPHERRIATLAIGYADGYDRRFGHGVGAVRLHGALAPVVGSVCMDMVMVDVTHIAAARPGDVAVVFGPGRPLPLLAAAIGTIAYELLTRVSERVKRVFVSE